MGTKKPIKHKEAEIKFKKKTATAGEEQKKQAMKK